MVGEMKRAPALVVDGRTTGLIMGSDLMHHGVDARVVDASPFRDLAARDDWCPCDARPRRRSRGDGRRVLVDRVRRRPQHRPTTGGASPACVSLIRDGSRTSEGPRTRVVTRHVPVPTKEDRAGCHQDDPRHDRRNRELFTKLL